MKKGYTIFAYGKDCFIVTDCQKRTKQLAYDFLNKIHNALNMVQSFTDRDVEFVQKNMLAATFEVKSCRYGDYYEIKGENFSFGCDPCENPLNTCVLV